MIALKRIGSDLLGLLFPELCNGCGDNLNRGEQEICVKCLYDLPYTDYHLYQENRVAKQFWGRLTFHAAMAMLYFKKGTKVQNLIHNLKYNGKTEVGTKFGHLMAERINRSELFKDIDLIIPVPLHHKRQRIRGYNQSEYIANGIAEVLNIPVSTSHLTRTKVTSTQTKKTRYYRFENMQTVFNVAHPEQIKNLHVLLIDDVITTGATLEACGIALLNCGIKKLSIAAVAFAE
jgi:ComF family protein